MNFNTLNEFRHGGYGWFRKAKDALFNLVDALASEAWGCSLDLFHLLSSFLVLSHQLYDSVRFALV